MIGPQAKGFWKRKGPIDMGPSDHVPIQWLTRAACSYTLFPVPEHETPVSPPSCPVEKQVKPFINKGSGAERPSGSILNLHRRNSIKVPRCYFSSHHLSEIPTRVICEPHVKSSSEPKRKKERKKEYEVRAAKMAVCPLTVLCRLFPHACTLL